MQFVVVLLANSNGCCPLHLCLVVNLSLQLKQYHRYVFFASYISHEGRVIGGVGFLLTIEELEVGVKESHATFF